jgi:hypothetical protein
MLLLLRGSLQAVKECRQVTIKRGVWRGRSQSGNQRDLEGAVEGNLIGNMLHALDAAEVRQKLVLQLYGTKLTIEAAAIIPIRE